MNNKSSEIVRKKGNDIFNKMLGAGLVVLAVVLYLNKQNLIWPILSLIVGIGLFASGSHIVSAQCPNCGNTISEIPDSEIYFECQKCESFLWNMKEEKRIEVMDPDFIASEPIFKWVLPWNGFALPGVTEAYGVIGGFMLNTNDSKLLEAKWPESCCICGSAADHQENISKKFRVTPGSKSGLIRSPITKDVSVFVNGIPHCQHHSGGAALKIANPGGVLAFCSLRYYQMFRKLNK